MLTENQAAKLYNIATASGAEWGCWKSTATVWTYNVRSQELYKLACEVAGTESLMSTEILPTIFSPEGTALIESVVKNEYYFWNVAAEFTSYPPDLPLVEATKRAISEIRNHHSRMSVNRFAALNGKMSPQQICKFTSLGMILWSNEVEDWILNPLWFSAKEFAESAITPTPVEA